MTGAQVQVPRQGDFIWLDMDPQAGHEQKGRRPALVISKTAFNEKTGMALVWPVTNTDRAYPFHIRIRGARKVSGVVMADQIKSLDYAARRSSRIEKADKTVVEDVLGLLDAIIF